MSEEQEGFASRGLICPQVYRARGSRAPPTTTVYHLGADWDEEAPAATSKDARSITTPARGTDPCCSRSARERQRTPGCSERGRQSRTFSSERDLDAPPGRCFDSPEIDAARERQLCHHEPAVLLPARLRCRRADRARADDQRVRGSNRQVLQRGQARPAR